MQSWWAQDQKYYKKLNNSKLLNNTVVDNTIIDQCEKSQPRHFQKTLKKSIKMFN